MGGARFRASRPAYRRGGLKLGSADWVEAALDDLTPEQTLALLEDPVVSIQVQDPDGVWQPVVGADRAELVLMFRESLKGIAQPDNPASQAAAEAAAPAQEGGEPAPPAIEAQASGWGAAFGDDFAKTLAAAAAASESAAASKTTGDAAQAAASGGGGQVPPPANPPKAKPAAAPKRTGGGGKRGSGKPKG